MSTEALSEYEDFLEMIPDLIREARRVAGRVLDNISDMLTETSVLFMMALAQMVVILTRGIDLSLGPVASVTGTLMAVLMVDYPVPGFVLPILVGAAAGLANGLLIVGLRLPPIIRSSAAISNWSWNCLGTPARKITWTWPTPGRYWMSITTVFRM